MSQFNTQTRRAGGEINVYTGLLAVAMLVLLAGIVLIGMRNIEQSGQDGMGGMFHLVD